MRPKSIDELISSGDAKPRFLLKRNRMREADGGDEVKKVKRCENNEVDRPQLEHKVSTNSNEKHVIHNDQGTFRDNIDEFNNSVDSDEYSPLVTIKSVKKAETFARRWFEKSLDEMNDRDWRIFKDDFEIVSKGEMVNPLRYWSELNVPSQLKDEVTTLFKEPSPIQRAAIPLALALRDLVGVAKTGSGKTMAYIIPLLAYILQIDLNSMHLRDYKDDQPLALVLAPARELALQITQETEKLCSKLNLKVVSIIGGHQFEETIVKLDNGVHIVVATPGRLIDSVERDILSLDRCFYLVLDEADRMVDLGFEQQLNAILDMMPKPSEEDRSIFHITKRIMLMFTATLSPTIEKLTHNFLDHPLFLFVGNKEIPKIDQRFEYEESIDHCSRLDASFKLVQGQPAVIIFANFKKTCEEISDSLSQKGINNVVIHGSKSQESRERALTSFRSGKSKVLVATDVAARGIDVPNVSLVINFHMTKKIDEYIHRIGRTGRAGKKGSSITFIDDEDSEIMVPLKKQLATSGVAIPKWLLKITRQAILTRD